LHIPQLILAIDGGQTSTGIWLLSKSRQYSGYRQTRGFQYSTEGGGIEATQTESIIAAISELVTEGSFTLTNIAAVSCSFSGHPPGLTDYLRNLPQAQVHVMEDSEAAYLGSLWREPGVSLISGTGTVALASDGTGKAVIGGWGYLFGDFGGAWGIVRQAVTAAAYASEDLGPATQLEEALLDHFQVKSFRTLIWDLYQGRRQRSHFGTAAPLVMRLAENGDVVARQVVYAGAKELADYVLAGMKRMRLQSPVTLGYSGGVLVGSEYLRRQITTLLKEQQVEVSSWLRGSALVGSALNALEMSGVEITAEVRQELAAKASELK
jgi:N-acetylglucosamine kinase-like BadF-type ATPase